MPAHPRPAWLDDFHRDGFALIPNALSPGEISALCEALERAAAGDGVLARGSGVYAMRNVVDLIPEAAAAVESPVVQHLVRAALGTEGFAVKATLFDKRPWANWHVGWHQDVTIAVREQVEEPGFSAWSVKAGVTHVQPPAEVLERMVAVRIHLDACGPENGALRVIPGSHHQGRLSSEQIQEWLAGTPAHVCSGSAGSALLMRPLLLHASSEAVAPEHRRVLHVEFAADPLPSGLEWNRIS
jgi:ectoine hydroxylase-related dioxygenase (phytanoyl-CoA dioxygenase family)